MLTNNELILTSANPIDGKQYMKSMDGGRASLESSFAHSEMVSGNPHNVLADDLGLSKSMLFAGSFDSTLSGYNVNDVVVDGAWTMIANTETSERAAPQPIGDPEYGFTDSPAWLTEEDVSVVYSGQLYEFTKSGWIYRIRAWIPELTDNTNNRFIIADVTNSENPIVTVIEEPVLNLDDWTYIEIGERIVTSGTKLLMFIDSLNSSSNSEVTGGWEFGGDSNSDVPVAGGWNRRKDNTIIRVNIEDLDTTDRSTELRGATLDSEFLFVQVSNTSKSLSYRVNAEPIDHGAYFEYSVDYLGDGIGGSVAKDEATNVTIDVPVAQSTKYVELLDYWNDNQPDYANVSGYLEFSTSGVVSGVSANGYGIDFRFQEGAVSEDWDFVSSNGVVGSTGALDPEQSAVLEIMERTYGDDNGIIIDGQLAVGKWDAPNELVVGQGDSTVETMLAYHTSDHLLFTNVTQILSSEEDSTIGLFGGSTSGNTIYMGSDFPSTGYKVKIFSDGIVEPDNVVAEFYTSGGWVPVNYMTSNADYPYDQHGHILASDNHIAEQWRFDFDPFNLTDDWIPSLFQGVVKYWGRFRVIATITTEPVIEQVKLHTSRWECNSDGATEYFGRARYKRTILSGVKSMENNSALSPANQPVSYAPGVIAGYTDNQFTNNAIDSRLFVLNIPEGQDTSVPVQVNISWYVEGTATGDVEFELSKIPVADGYVYDGSSTLEGTTNSITTISADSNLIRRTTTMYLEVPEAIPGEVAYLCVLSRDATAPNGNDTLGANVIMTHIVVNAYFWKP